MPAKSKKQQRFMGMVHAYQTGQLDNASPEVKKVAKSMKKGDAEDFASTKHKGLPEKVKKAKKKESRIYDFETFINEAYPFIKELPDQSLDDISKEKEPQIDDYVICYKEDDDYIDEDLNEFFKTNIGKIIDISVGTNDYYVKYKNMPQELWDDNKMDFHRNEILYFSSNKNDVKGYLKSKKYNI